MKLSSSSGICDLCTIRIIIKHMRKQIAAGNWKMNLTFEEGENLVNALKSVSKPDNVLTIVGVPTPYLKSFQDICENESLCVAAQNIHHEQKGAYTGETSANMVKSIGVKYVIIGHSERREYQNESNELLKTKVDLALEHGLTPIFCCGESLDIRKSGSQNDFVSNQLKESLFHLAAEDLSRLIIAYEPIWAIGTGETASPKQAQEMHQALRSFIGDSYGQDIANGISILYGGSVKPANAKDIFGQADVDGGLVGGASLKAEDFTQIIHSF